MFNDEDILRLKYEKVNSFTQTAKMSDDEIGIHLESLKKDFIGKSALSYELVGLIVCIRREKNVDENFEIFYKLVTGESSFLSKELNLRWIISVMDTIADHAPEGEACTALMLSVIVNMMKLAETEKKCFMTGKRFQMKITMVILILFSME